MLGLFVRGSAMRCAGQHSLLPLFAHVPCTPQEVKGKKEAARLLDELAALARQADAGSSYASRDGHSAEAHAHAAQVCNLQPRVQAPMHGNMRMSLYFACVCSAP